MKEPFYIKYSVFLISIPTLWVGFFPSKIVVVTAICLYPLLISFILNQRSNEYIKHNKYNIEYQKLITCFVMYNIILFVRGIFNNLYSNFDLLVYSNNIFIAVLYPLYLYKITPNSLAVILNMYLKIGIPVSFILMLIGIAGGNMDPSHTFSGIYIFILFIPYLAKKWKLLIIVLSCISVFYDISVRSNLINMLVAYLILIPLSFDGEIIRKRIWSIMAKVFILAPIIFFTLGITGVFNVFKISDYYELSYEISSQSRDRDRELFVDSRTGIYQDVLETLKDKDAYLWGLGMAGKAQATIFSVEYDAIYKDGRSWQEAGMLNNIQWGGAIGACLYFLLFAVGSFLCVSRSNNQFMKMFGVWMAFKALFSFIEDSQSANIYYFLLIISIGLCFNKQLREMTDSEIKLYTKKIFKL